ncbi:hypothetical protein MJO28_007151, partial [Puccinia striiformis f. sp. tritici]
MANQMYWNHNEVDKGLSSNGVLLGWCRSSHQNIRGDAGQQVWGNLRGSQHDHQDPLQTAYWQELRLGSVQ